MENANKYLFCSFVGIIICLSMTILVNGQGYKGIIPLQSNCEDVKRILKVKECTYPRSEYEFENFQISVWFTKEKPNKDERICWDVPAGTVLSISVSYDIPILLSKFEHPLKFVKGPINDIFMMLYKNEERALEAYIMDDSVKQVIYLPTEAKRKKLSYACKSPDAGDDVELPEAWIERYWKISAEKERQILNYAVEVFKETPLNKEIYIVYFYKCENDKASGIEQARRAKLFLENNGIASERVKIFNGGKEEKSELVLYLVKVY